MLHFPLITVNAIRKDNGMQNGNKTRDLVILTHLANYLWRHSRQKWKYSLETWAVYREIFRVSWNLPNDPKHRGLFLKNKTSSEGYQLLEWAFMLLWIKYRLIYFKLEGSRIKHEPSYIKHTFREKVIAQKMKFSIKDFSCKCDQISSFLRIWSHLLEKSWM